MAVADSKAKEIQITFRAGPMDGGAAVYKLNQKIERVIDVTPETADPNVIPVCHLHRYVYNGLYYTYEGAFSFRRKA